MNIATGGKFGVLKGAADFVTRRPTREQRIAAEREAKDDIVSSLFDILER